MPTPDEVKHVLVDSYGFSVVEEKPIQSGLQLKTREGPMVNVYTTGTMTKCGSKLELIGDLEQRIQDAATKTGATATGRKVFVVYGHDEGARTQLEAMLRRWNLEPILLDQLTSQGDTLIEKLERNTSDAAFAIVLATPDDEGHPKDRNDEKKFRARQNVVLELGMMLRGLGRKKVAILLQQLGFDTLIWPHRAGLIWPHL